MPAMQPVHMVEPELSTLSRSIQPGRRYLLHRPGSLSRPILILDTRRSRLGVQEAYVSFIGQDKRLDTWIPQNDIGEEIDGTEAGPSALAIRSPNGTKRRKLDKPLLTPTRLSFSEQTGHRPAAAETASAPSTPEREHAAMTRVRNFEDVRFGEYLIRTWYYSPYPFPPDETPHTHPSGSTPQANASSSKKKAGHGGASGEAKGKGISASRSIGDLYGAGIKGGEGARGRLWVCDLCFKYMRTRAAWERHSSSCQQFLPPGRRVYQRGSYTIWEVDGAAATLYCQNLSLFGKLFIDHKSVFFHVENFLFYIMCDASTSYRDQPMAFFSKEKVSFDDYNLACIVTFPPFQGNGFGKLLIEFSYHLTKHPSTRPLNLSPGTPERPLSDLGLKGYLAYWSSTILRYLRQVLSDAPPLNSIQTVNGTVGKGKTVENGRSLRRRSSGLVEGKIINLANARAIRLDHPAHKGQYSLIITLAALASACHLRVDDTVMTLTELGLLRHTRAATIAPPKPKPKLKGEGMNAESDEGGEEADSREDEAENGDEEDQGEWKDVEVVISREEVERLIKFWGVRERAMLDPQYVLL